MEIEVKFAIWDLSQTEHVVQKAFNLFLCQIVQDQIKQDFMGLFAELTRANAILDNINYSQVVLIRKNIPSRVSDYGPIALLNNICKVVHNVLANRLSPLRK